jgi:hypothetical protein
MLGGIRPELRAQIYRFREGIVAALGVALALWLAAQGGYFLTPLGLALAALAAVWGAVALRRARFARPISAPGLVELDEGRIGYFGAGKGLGGYIEIDDLSEIRLIQMRGVPHWRLKATTHAERLYDAFARLPGIDMAVLTDALAAAHSERPAIEGGASARIAAQSLWRRTP